MSRPFEVEIHFPVRTYDIDFAGIVSNIVYIRWLEDLRLAMLDTYFPLKNLVDAGLSPILLATEITYRRAIRLFDEPIGRMWLVGIGKARWALEADITVGATVAATARQSCAVISLSTFRPRPLPPELRQAFTA